MVARCVEKILENEVIFGERSVVGKKSYEKPFIEKQYGMNFPREIVEGISDGYCRQCSGCHGCR